MIITAPLMLFSGATLGFFYFSGLYLTLWRVSTKDNRMGWLISSFLFRVSILIAALYLLADHDWQRLLLLAAGFTVSRFFWLRKMKKEIKP